MTSPVANNAAIVPTHNDAPTQTPQAETPAANANASSANLTQGQDICAVDNKSINAPVLIERPLNETKTIDVQPGHDYLFGFTKADVTSVTQSGDTVTMKFDCGGVLILKNYYQWKK